MITITLQTAFYIQSCCTCGIAFGLPDTYDTRLRDTHDLFYCPNGHPQSYRAKSAADIERDKRILSEQRLEQAKAARLEAELDAAKARASAKRETAKRKKVERRVQCGVCPKCNRSFRALQRHMASQHPETPTDG